MIRFVRVALVAAVCVLSAATAFAQSGPSFDCAKAANAIERTICKDPELAKAESRHAAEIESLKAEKSSVEEQLKRSRDECAKLHDYIESMKKQVETTWASERMANAVLRERINDVASEVVRVAVALEGLNSPMDSLVAGKTASVQARTDDASIDGENGEISLPASVGNGDGTSSELIHRIRALRQRTARATAAP